MSELASPTWSRVLRAVAALAIALPHFVSAQNAGTVPPPKTTDQAFKNIQILKGIPADQLIPTMQFISASLGVECEYCHVEGAFDKDDKKPKQTARKMMAADCHWPAMPATSQAQVTLSMGCWVWDQLVLTRAAT